MYNTKSIFLTEMVNNIKKHPAIYLLYTGVFDDNSFKPLYVGSSTEPVRRKNNHLSNLARGKHQNSRLQSWYDNHNSADLKYVILEYLVTYDNYVSTQIYYNIKSSKDEFRKHIISREQYYIDMYRPYGIFNYNDATFSSWGYNIGRKLNKQTRKKQSVSARNNFTDERRIAAGKRLNDLRTNKVLVFGDIHLNISIIPKVEKMFIDGDYDRLIFLGDEFDSFHLSYDNAPVILDQLIMLHNKYNKMAKKFVWVAGNHTLSYLTDVHCSGFNRDTYNKIHYKLLRAKEDGYILPFYVFKNVLYSHAGLTNNWLKIFNGSDTKTRLRSVKENWKNNRYDLFNMAGYDRGGSSDLASCMWADKTELLDDYLQSNIVGREHVWKQVCGHTPVTTIESHLDNHIFFVDTFSTYRDGTPIGDETVLEIIDGTTFNILKLKEINNDNNNNTSSI